MEFKGAAMNHAVKKYGARVGWALFVFVMFVIGVLDLLIWMAL